MDHRIPCFFQFKSALKQCAVPFYKNPALSGLLFHPSLLVASEGAAAYLQVFNFPDHSLSKLLYSEY